MRSQSLLLLTSCLGFVCAKVAYLGINIAGFEFGCLIDGTCPFDAIIPPLTSLGGPDGAGQMQHFVTDDNMNIFRLPVSWQFLLNNKLGGKLDADKFAQFDALVAACLDTGAYCIIDIHNFSRWNGAIISQTKGGPTDAQFADVWSQLATYYAKQTKVIFEIVNEPHELDVPTWATTCQAVVTAIRKAGATSQMILIPGTNFASAGKFVSSGSAAALLGITNPDGTTDGLIFDLHKYLDVDNSGTNAACITDNIADAFAIVAAWLRTNKRLAMVSETGASSDPTCFVNFCAQNTYINANSDVFIGLVAWGAGALDTDYLATLTPVETDGVWVDQALAVKCVIAPWVGNGTLTKASSKTSSTAKSTATPVATTVGNTTVTTKAAVTVLQSTVGGAAATTTGAKSTSTGSAGEKVGVAGSLLAGGILLAAML